MPTRLASRLSVTYQAFIEEVRGHISPGTSEKISLYIGVGRDGYTLNVAEGDTFPFAFLDADDPGGPEAVAKLVEEAVLDKKPWLISG